MLKEYRKQLIEELEDSAVLILNLDGTVTSWNKKAEQIKKYSAKEIIGQNFNIFYLPEDRQRHLPEKILREAKEKGTAFYDGWRVRKDGSTFYGIMMLTAQLDEKNQFIGFTKLIHEITLVSI